MSSSSSSSSSSSLSFSSTSSSASVPRALAIPPRYHRIADVLASLDLSNGPLLGLVQSNYLMDVAFDDDLDGTISELQKVIKEGGVEIPPFLC